MRWTNEVLPGRLAQELALPSDFEQAGSLVTEDMMADQFPLGPDRDRWLKAIQEYVDAGYDEIYLSQMGKDQAGFLDFYRAELAPRLG